MVSIEVRQGVESTPLYASGTALAMRAVRRFSAACLVVSLHFAGLAASPATAQTPGMAQAEMDRAFQEAYAHFKRGEYGAALDGFSRLAERGHLAAQYDLGWMRAQGLGLPTDMVVAYQWFALVEKAGQTRGSAALEDIRPLMTPEEIAEGERRAAAWRPLP